jgi:hypothetical protein
MAMTESSMNSGFEPVQVDGYSGYKANERPVVFTFQGRRLEILEILDRWYEGGMTPEAAVVDYYKVKTDDGNMFILRYETQSGQWAGRVYGKK